MLLNHRKYFHHGQHVARWAGVLLNKNAEWTINRLLTISETCRILP